MAGFIASDAALTERAVDTFAASDAKSAFPFARRLAELVPQPIALFEAALKKAEESPGEANLQFFGGMISGFDSYDPKAARECVRAALRSAKLKPHAISMIGSGKLRPEDLELVISLLQAKDIEPWQCSPLSYGRGLDHLTSIEIAPLLDELMKHGAQGQWTALDIIFMYLHPAKVPDAILARKLKAIVTSPRLFDVVNRRTMDGYHLEQTVALLAKHNLLDGPHVRTLTRRMLSLAKVKDSAIFFELDDPVRKILTTLIAIFANEVWAEIAPLLIAKDQLLRHQVQRLIGTGFGDNLAAGPLGGMPEAIYLDWVGKDPDNRAAEVLRWLPVAVKGDQGALSWHPAVESFVLKFGSHASVLQALARRMHPTSWSGSLVPYLEPWIPLLRVWEQHPLVEVRNWAHRQIEGLQQRIAAEKNSDEEDVVRWG